MRRKDEDISRVSSRSYEDVRLAFEAANDLPTPLLGTERRLRLTEMDQNDWSQLASFVAGRTLVKLHALEFVHGDLHPGNVLAGPSRFPRASVNDFGFTHRRPLLPRNMAVDLHAASLTFGSANFQGLLAGYVTDAYLLLDKRRANYTTDLLTIIGGTIETSPAPRERTVSETAILSAFSSFAMLANPVEAIKLVELGDQETSLALLLAIAMMDSKAHPTLTELVKGPQFRTVAPSTPMGVKRTLIAELAEASQLRRGPFDPRFDAEAKTLHWPDVTRAFIVIRPLLQRCPQQVAIQIIDEQIDIFLHAAALQDQARGAGEGHHVASIELARFCNVLFSLVQDDPYRAESRLAFLRSHVDTISWAHDRTRYYQSLSSSSAVDAILSDAHLLVTLASWSQEGNLSAGIKLADSVVLCAEAFRRLASQSMASRQESEWLRRTRKAAWLLAFTLRMNFSELLVHGHEYIAANTDSLDHTNYGFEEAVALNAALETDNTSSREVQQAFDRCVGVAHT